MFNIRGKHCIYVPQHRLLVVPLVLRVKHTEFSWEGYAWVTVILLRWDNNCNDSILPSHAHPINLVVCFLADPLSSLKQGRYSCRFDHHVLQVVGVPGSHLMLFSPVQKTRFSLTRSYPAIQCGFRSHPFNHSN